MGFAAPARADWLFGAYLGASHTLANSLSVRTGSVSQTVEEVTYRSESFRSPQYYGVRLGYFFRQQPRFGIEAELIHLKVFANVTPALLAMGVRQFSISHGLNHVVANIVLRQPVGGSADRPRGWITARGGAGFTVPHGESLVDGTFQEQYERGGLGSRELTP